MSIELHIERLVLDEALLGGESAHAVRHAIERELAKHLTRTESIDVLRSIGSVAALPSSALPPPAHPRQQLSSRIAMAVGQGMGIGVAAGRAL